MELRLMLFFIVTTLVLTLFFFLFLRLLKQVFADLALVIMRRVFLFLDAIIVVGMALAATVLKEASWVGPIIRFLSIVAVFQVLFTILVLLGLAFVKLGAIFGNAPFDSKRRQLLKHGAAYPVIALAASLYGGLVEWDDTVERELIIPVKDLPEKLKGFRITQISDVHLGLHFDLDRLRKLLERTVALKPDALLITGDLFDNRKMNPEAAKIVDSFTSRFPLGIWYCHGNHEHRRGIEAIEEYISQTNIHFLKNSAAEVIPDASHPLYFAGVDYPMNRATFEQDKAAFFKEAMAGVPAGAITVLLAHHPEFIDNAAAGKVALTLTGHTHGCQFGFMGICLAPVFKYNRGMVKIGDSYGYVHSGNGSWFPYRLGCPPEIVSFTLRRE